MAEGQIEQRPLRSGKTKGSRGGLSYGQGLPEYCNAPDRFVSEEADGGEVVRGLDSVGAEVICLCSPRMRAMSEGHSAPSRSDFWRSTAL